MTHARMLGTCRQPFCKKCCGTHTKADTQKVKRSERRATKQDLKLDIAKGRV